MGTQRDVDPQAVTELHDAPIVPMDYSPPEPGKRANRRRLPEPARIVAGAALLVVGVLVWFLVTAQSLRVESAPTDASFAIEGGLHLRVGKSVLLRIGEYRVTATAPGYRTLERAFNVVHGPNTLKLALDKLPGLLALHTEPGAARVLVDGKELGQSNGAPLEIPAGTHRLRLEATRFLPLEQPLEVEGLGKQQSLSLTLAPGWGNYRLATEPPGATVTLDGKIGRAHV